MAISSNQLKNLIRVGRVSTVDPSTATATVTFPDKDDLVSRSLPVLQLGSKDNKTYWMPDIDSQVLCVFQPNPSGKGLGYGAVLGCMYSTADPPDDTDANVKAVRFADGSYIKYEDGNLDIYMTGTITINASQINLN